MYSGTSMVHVHGYQNIGRPESTLTALASLNIRLDALVEHIMAELILSSATRITMRIGISYLHGMSSVSIYGAPFHSNISQSITY